MSCALNLNQTSTIGLRAWDGYFSSCYNFHNNNLCHQLTVSSIGDLAGKVDVSCGFLAEAVSSLRKVNDTVTCPPQFYLVRVAQNYWPDNATNNARNNARNIELKHKLVRCEAQNFAPKNLSSPDEAVLEYGFPPGFTGQLSPRKFELHSFRSFTWRSHSNLCQKSTLLHKGEYAGFLNMACTVFRNKKNKSSVWSAHLFSKPGDSFVCHPTDENHQAESTFRYQGRFWDLWEGNQPGKDASAKLKYQLVSCNEVENGATSSSFKNVPSLTMFAISIIFFLVL